MSSISKKRQRPHESYQGGKERGVRIQLESGISGNSVTQDKHVSKAKRQKKGHEIYSINYLPTNSESVQWEATGQFDNQLVPSSYSQNSNKFIAYSKQYSSESEGTDSPENSDIHDDPETDEDVLESKLRWKERHHHREPIEKASPL
jgi:hypothetical protein